MDDVGASPHAIVTLVYAFAALFALAGAFAWLRLVNRRSAQSSAGKTPDGLSNAATATALAMFCAGAAFLFSLLI